jgi:hypothetical protein
MILATVWRLAHQDAFVWALACINAVAWLIATPVYVRREARRYDQSFDVRDVIGHLLYAMTFGVLLTTGITMGVISLAASPFYH